MSELKDNSNITINKIPEKNFIHEFNVTEKPKVGILVAVVILIIGSGILSGFLLSSGFSRSGSVSSLTGKSSDNQVKLVVGSDDEKLFSDSVEGTLDIGGIDGEGTHKLIRPGGDSQTVYLTSSVLDLGQFIGKKVRLRGKTYAAKKAGWFMDVGKLEVLQ
ncbi:hypothetical protein A2960_00395 [Candidatus Gottesmanbacteria bacterium RIFCSPLOWO2_01_FULL_39_12b]|uniref:Uncharacterized protein n=1 Tax=Candidatus Gottesmanbacteria bacterium RIFCSPLOWO2_01_FULL_39_12b TaxID=1798388 RepID=A0A1F6APK3_9BACT|nr:MAG: hypothetical protein A2960_00395 [Candidatus Gottesmanbacteria bacterium RIFCSPLOWO2_01_FULL_39_12b]